MINTSVKMGTQTTLFIAGVMGLTAMYFYNNFFQLAPLPKLEDTYWGPGLPPKEVDTSIKPFKISASKEVLDDLRSRLKNHRPLTPSMENTQQQYGMNSKLLEEVVQFWLNDYKWEEREKYLNKFPQFKTKIQGLDIHFLRVKPDEKAIKNKKVVPLLILHGWPGSVREFYEVIPDLVKARDDKDFVFEVIAPSLPGYGFSDGASKAGLGSAQIAVVFKNLMERLGFKEFYVQGGDLGSLVAANLGLLFPERVKGMHSNLCQSMTPCSLIKTWFGSYFPSYFGPEAFIDKMYPLSKRFTTLLIESGYFHIQSTKPDTVGAGVGDSPVGLAAYILEKFTVATNYTWKFREDGGLKEKFTYNDLIDNLMFYWIPNSATTAFRLYAESFNKAQFGLGLQKHPINVPTACAKFPNEIFYQPDSFLKDRYPMLIHSKEMPKGGHFAAFEEPKLFTEDLWEATEKFEKFHKEKQTQKSNENQNNNNNNKNKEKKV